METYRYTGNYCELHTEEPLGTEGLLEGPFGKLFFKRCHDGFAIIDSCFPGTGFICWPTSADLGFPGFINDIPVTEIRQSISISNTHPIAIEATELKRAYLRIKRASSAEKLSEADEGLAALLRLMLEHQENVNQKEKFLEVSVEFFNKDKSIDSCWIQTDERCILHGVAAKHLSVEAPSVVLEDHAYEKLEWAEFTGKVYPYLYSDWDGEYFNTRYFSGIKSLRMVDGSLRGDDCWNFAGCVSLEKVHLANGIKRILPHSFENCTSLTDLYVPDTVTEIGEFAFAGCTNLKTIHLPSGIKTISRGMFMGCRSLLKCYLSDEIEVIEDDAFKGCESLKKPWIPRNIKTISETAFDQKVSVSI